MDTSKEYIKMCEKAGEIQKKWECAKGDFYTHKVLFREKGRCVNDISIDGTTTIMFGEDIKFIDNIWLPRQDQLQEMIFVDWGTPEKIDGFFTWYYAIFKDDNKNYQYEASWSMEQLWLAFVIKEKYNKVWNGKEWKRM